MLFLLLLTLLCAPHLRAQAIGGILTGTVTDPENRVLDGATVTATETARGVVFRGTTNSAGIYRLAMPIGNYTLQVAMSGFATVSRPAFDLELGQTDQINFQMKLGSSSETVEVSASENPLLKRDTAQIDTVIDENTVDNLPLATRNYVQLTLLAPGTTHPDPASMTTVQGQQTAGRPFINGNNEQSNNFLLDGLENNQLSDNLIAYTPSVDAIQEFTVITQNPSAAYGNFQGGTVTTAVKSGANEFHGRAFEFVRNDALNASPWSEGNTDGVTKTKLRWNMFGGTLGGPVLRKKLFFFADYQGQRYDIPAQSQSATVMTARMQAGDFSEVLPSSTSFADNPGITLGDPSADMVGSQRSALTENNLANVANSTTAFPGIDGVAKALFATGLYPTPNFTTTPAGDYGSCRNGTIRGPGEMDFDLSVQKVFDLGTKAHLQFRAEAVNAFNHPLYQMPDTFLSDGSAFGVDSGATAAENERQVQFGLKLFY
jgi:hypothetical protein